MGIRGQAKIRIKRKTVSSPAVVTPISASASLQEKRQRLHDEILQGRLPMKLFNEIGDKASPAMTKVYQGLKEILDSLLQTNRMTVQGENASYVFYKVKHHGTDYRLEISTVNRNQNDFRKASIVTVHQGNDSRRDYFDYLGNHRSEGNLSPDITEVSFMFLNALAHISVSSTPEEIAEFWKKTSWLT